MHVNSVKDQCPWRAATYFKNLPY